MANFVWSATDPSGRNVVKEVQADSATEARDKLHAEGFSQLKLEEELIVDAMAAGIPDPPLFLGEKLTVTAEQRLKARDNRTDSFLILLVKGLKQSGLLGIIIGLLAALSICMGWWIALGCLILALLAWLTFTTLLGAPLLYYRKMNFALDWARWDEVLSLIETCKSANRYSVAKVPDTELIRLRAKALAGQGNLGEALAEFQKCEGHPSYPNWLYKVFVAEIYGVVKQYDTAIMYTLQSLAEKPQAIIFLDLAN